MSFQILFCHTHHHLADRADELGPAKTQLDQFALALGDAIALGGSYVVMRALPMSCIRQRATKKKAAQRQP